MDLVTAIATYFLIWWITLFLVLPRGELTKPDAPKQGHDIGAPEVANIKQKFIINTILAFVIWSVAYILIWLFDFNLRDFLP